MSPFPHRSVCPPLAVALLALALAACHHPAPVTAAAPIPAPAANDDSLRLARARADSIARADQMRRDAAAREAAQQAAARARGELTTAIYFEFDSDALSDAARAALDAKLPLLTASGTVTLRVDGNTDERGSDEYNLALGQRRAATAKRYLTQHGIAENRVAVISFGEERPANSGHDESAWTQNRRDDFEITGGTVTGGGTVP